jgi:hypothetical protein
MACAMNAKEAMLRHAKFSPQTPVHLLPFYKVSLKCHEYCVPYNFYVISDGSLSISIEVNIACLLFTEVNIQHEQTHLV